ncbi:MAG TPA: hypothetical protein VFT12_11720, partial [Thermoanaerobaculia bacterium]|nr:hypothetical protein [Thermoanaerobaculia bacterium]
ESVPLRFDPETLAEDQFGPPRPNRSPLLTDAEEAFVRRGGRMIIAAPSGTVPSTDIKDNIARKVFPIWPPLGDLEICDCAKGFTALGPRMHAIYTAGTRVIVAREPIGAGELFLVSTPEIFQNDELAHGDRLQLLVALAGADRPVYFDEVAHGIVSGDGPMALLKEFRLGPFLMMLLGIALLVFWRHGRRIGPPEDDYREARSDSVDLVRSLAALYHEVTPDAEALRLYHDALARTIAAQSGLRGDALRKRVEELTGGFVPPPARSKIPAAIFRRDLNILNEGFQKAQRVKR